MQAKTDFSFLLRLLSTLRMSNIDRVHSIYSLNPLLIFFFNTNKYQNWQSAIVRYIYICVYIYEIDIHESNYRLSKEVDGLTLGLFSKSYLRLYPLSLRDGWISTYWCRSLLRQALHSIRIDDNGEDIDDRLAMFFSLSLLCLSFSFLLLMTTHQAQ
jgi:hypothetical protein